MNHFNQKEVPMTQKVIVLTGFAKLSDAEALATAGAVIKGIYVDKVFAAPPPFDEATLRTSVDDLTGSIATQAQAGGGTAVTTVKNKKRDVLDGLLRKLAHYVQANVSSLSSNSPFLLQPRRCCSTWTWRDWFAARPTFWYRFLQLIGTVVGAIRGAALPFFIFHVATFRWLERPVPAYQL